jgi:glycosyltransferase involved in cell wall biosynthesis
MPISISGVANQTRFMCQALLDSGDFEVVSIGAINQAESNMSPFYVKEYGENWKIYPYQNFGDENLIRVILESEKPDILWMMTDPRFYYWLWSMENEIREKIPIVYYHVWDNFPVPQYNKPWYDSCDTVVAISKLTYEIVNSVTTKSTNPEDCELIYLPHAPEPAFRPHVSDSDKKKLEDLLFDGPKTKKMFFYNSRNAKRKMTASLVYWFKDFLDIVGEDNAVLVLNTNPFDEYGSNLHEIVKERGLNKNNSVLFIQDRVSPATLSALYNIADFTVCPSDAEGFGISSLESMACGTPVISTRTGGLQDQNITEDGEILGESIVPVSKAIIGSQEIPYIFEDRIGKEDFLAAMLRCYNLTAEEYDILSKKCSSHVEKNFSFDSYRTEWVKLMKNINKKHGSFGSRVKSAMPPKFTMEEV